LFQVEYAVYETLLKCVEISRIQAYQGTGNELVTDKTFCRSLM